MDYIDTNKLDSNSEIEEDIDEYHKSNNSNPRKNTSNNSVVKNLACNKSQEATGKSLAYNRNKKATGKNFMFGILLYNKSYYIT